VLFRSVVAVVIPWILLTKKDSTAAVAWCLVVLLMPLVGALLFWMFGYNYLLRRMRRGRFARPLFRERHSHPPGSEPPREGAGPPGERDLSRLALEVNAFPARDGNAVALYPETRAAFAALLDAIGRARNHVHLEYFILRGDATGKELLELLTRKAKEGVEVRLLYDALGCWYLNRELLRPLAAAGGKVAGFLPLNPVRSLIRVNLRNHRKITVVDGRVGFTGGMNIGDEYLGLKPAFGYWRDAFLRLEGPAVADLQRVFCEDWDFASQETLGGPAYFPDLPPAGEARVQVAESGPDQEINTLREIYFMAIDRKSVV